MLVLLLLQLPLFVMSGDKPVKRVVHVTQENGILENDVTVDALARVEFKDLMDKTGWSFLKITTNASVSDEVQAMAAGVGEGFVTATRILQTWRNTMSGYCVKSSDYCDKLKVYMDTNMKWMKSMIELHKHTSSYWHHINLLLLQIQGLHEGFSRVYPDTLTLHQFQLLNLNLDLIDMEDALGTDMKGYHRNKPSGQVTREQMRMMENVLGSGHCTAFIKWTKDDLLVSHVTWNGYTAMLRVVKHYDFSFRTGPGSAEIIPGRRSVFTSYPGYVFSGDDFTISGSGVFSQETTIPALNSDLWKHVKPVGSVPEYLRSVVSNRLAKDGVTWCTIFQQYNSGTYNNQWMIVDYNKFIPGRNKLKDGTLYILEQLPGTIVYKDRSDFLNAQQYWPSYNLPYFPVISNLSGIHEFVDRFGDIFSYDKNPRAMIFKRDAPKVTDMDSLYKLMRYNDYQHDPLSECDCSPPYSAINAISSRCDLNPPNGTFPLPLFGAALNGGIDYKGTNAGLVKKLGMRIAGGPTWEQQPPFRWSTSNWWNTTHEGMTDLQRFPEITVIADETDHWI